MATPVPQAPFRPLRGLVLAGALLTGADEAAADSDPRRAAATPSPWIAGEVANVDLGRRSLTLKVEDPSREFREVLLPLDDQSEIVSGGRTLSLDQVRSGERALAHCSSPDGRGRRTCRVRIRPNSPARVPGS